MRTRIIQHHQIQCGFSPEFNYLPQMQQAAVTAAVTAAHFEWSINYTTIHTSRATLAMQPSKGNCEVSNKQQLQ